VKQTPQKSAYAAELDLSDEASIEELLEDYGFYETAFRDGQWAATKKMVKQLVEKEGRAPDTAVRIAVQRCAPALAKKYLLRADNFGQTPNLTGQVGGRYDAIDHGNGFFSIINIEIFAEVPAGAKRNKERIGEDWMDEAIAKNRLRKKEGFLPPVHIWHSDETAVKPSYAGKFVLTRRGTITYEGREIPALFANIVDIPKEVFQRIQQGLLPYRSVEVHDWENPEIDSLALMDTDVPFFRMRMTTVGDVKKSKDPVVAFKHVMKTPMQYFQTLMDSRLSVEGALICFRMHDKGANMATSISTTKPGKTGKGELANNVMPASKNTTEEGLTGQESGTGGRVGPSSGTATEDQDSIVQSKGAGLDDGVAGSKRQPGGTQDDEVNMDDGGHSGGPADGVETNTAHGGTEDAQVKMDDGMGGAGNGQVIALLQQVLQLLQGGGAAPAPMPAAQPPESPAQDLAPVSGMRANRANGGNMSSSVEKILLRVTTPLQAEIARLRKESDGVKLKNKIEGMVAWAHKQLEGYALDDELEANLLRAAKYGPEDLKACVSLIKKTQPIDPPESAEAFELALSDHPEGAEVNKFLADHPGTRANEWTRMQARTHAEYVARTGSDITLKDWLKVNDKYEKDVAFFSDKGNKPSAETMKAIRTGAL
jgi:hypothetical protein